MLSSVSEKSTAKMLPSPWNQRVRQYDLDSPGIRFATIQSFKGLESAAIVVTDVEKLEVAEQASLFYVAITRALEEVVIIAHENVKKDIRAVLSQR